MLAFVGLSVPLRGQEDAVRGCLSPPGAQETLVNTRSSERVSRVEGGLTGRMSLSELVLVLLLSGYRRITEWKRLQSSWSARREPTGV